jgi:hypothetical protein
VEIPDLTSPKGDYIKDNTFSLEGRVDEVSFTTDVAKNAVVFSCDKITAKFNSKHFRYKVAPLLVSKGHVEVDMNKIGITIGLQFTAKTLPDGRIVPNIEAVDVNVDINRKDIKMHMFGNLLTDIGSIFEALFKSTVVGMIQDSVSFTLNTAIPKISNGILDYTDGFVPVPLVKDWAIDWETPEAAVITETSFGIGVKGLFFDRAIGEEDPGVVIPDMPYKDSSKNARAQAHVSSYDIDAFFSSLTEVFNMEGWVRAKEIPITPNPLNTDTLDLMMPGMK